MADVQIRDLLTKHESQIDTLGQRLLAGDDEGFAAAMVGLVTTLASGVPLLGALADKVVARAFAGSANAMLRRELAVLQQEEDRRRFVGELGEAVEALIGQALIQLATMQHNVKDELLQALGGVRSDLAEFRTELAGQLGDYSVRLELQEVLEGGVGVRVSSQSQKRVWITTQRVRGKGSVGIDLG